MMFYNIMNLEPSYPALITVQPRPHCPTLPNPTLPYPTLTNPTQP